MISTLLRRLYLRLSYSLAVPRAILPRIHDLTPLSSKPSGISRYRKPHEDTHPAPSNPPVVKRLVRPIRLWRIEPSQAVALDEFDAAQDAATISMRATTVLRRERAKALHLCSVSPNTLAVDEASS